MANTLYPPVIDNTVSAFVLDDRQECEVNFYFQNSSAQVNTEYVFVKITNSQGENLLQTDSVALYQCIKDDFSTISTLENAHRTKYSIYINKSHLKEGVFKINNRFNISIMSIINDINIVNELLAKPSNQLSIWINNLNNNNKHSVWSDVIAKFHIAKPTILLTDRYGRNLNEEEDLVLEDPYTIKGKLTFNTDINHYETDVLAWYQIELQQQNENGIIVLDKTGRLYPNRLKDGDYSFSYTFNYDFNELENNIPVLPILGYDENGIPIVDIDYAWENGLIALNQDDFKSINIVITYATGKGYIERQVETFKWLIDPTLQTDNELSFVEITEGEALRVVPNNDKGFVFLQIKLQNNNIETRKGTLVFQKKKTEEKEWKTFYEKKDFVIAGNGLRLGEAYDYSAESGVFYNYRVQYYYLNRQEETFDKSEKIIKIYAFNEVENTNNNILILDDAFLCTKDLTLKIRYNPDLNSYKRNIIDSIMPTLGGAYPFVRRNGQQIYRTFNIGGLISFNQEVTIDTSGEDIFNNSMFLNVNQLIDINTGLYESEYKKGNLSLQAKERIYEKLFRDKVMDFLYKDQIILFKSLEEGNIFVKLVNITFSPNKQLGRMIYSFSAQAVEVLEFSNDNYLQYFKDDWNEEIVFTDIYIKTLEDALVNNHSLQYISSDAIIKGESGELLLQLYQLKDGAISFYNLNKDGGS